MGTLARAFFVAGFLGCSLAQAADIEFTLPYTNIDEDTWVHDRDARNNRELLAELMKRTQLSWDVRPMANLRIFDEIQHAANRCIANCTETTSDERGLIFIDLIDTRFVLLARDANHPAIRKLEDAATLRVGAGIGTRAALILQAAGIKAELAAREPLNAEKLNRGRIDLWFTTEHMVQSIQPEPAPTVVYRGEKVRVGLGCNPKIDPGVLVLLRAAAEDLRRDRLRAGASLN